ncbi:MAG TPA: hypothetical protein VM537_25340 [Anaerolineae bacterium]|nr:hypothetical protein [Anaerolineae bacterium]
MSVELTKEELARAAALNRRLDALRCSCGAVASLARAEADRDEFSQRLREEGEDLMANGRELAEAYPDEALEGRARIMAGLSLVELAASWPRQKQHAAHMAKLNGLKKKIEEMNAEQKTESQPAHLTAEPDDAQ